MSLDHRLAAPVVGGTAAVPASVFAERRRPVPLGSIVVRGIIAAHGVLLGALYLFLLHAPSQVLGGVLQSLQKRMLVSPGQAIDPTLLILILLLSIGAFVLAVAVFFLFPLVQGGILGQVRDRLESGDQPPRPFGAYGRAFYVRLLGSQGLFLLVMLSIMLPVMFLAVTLAFQQLNNTLEDLSKLPANVEDARQTVDPQQLNRQFIMLPTMLTAMAIASLLAWAVAMVYWVANCIIVSEQEGVLASWGKAFGFCWQNLPAILAVWLVVLGLGILISPIGMVGQLGIVTEPWALVALALLYAALIGYSGVLLAGVCMSLYLARQPSSGELRPELSTVDT